MPDSVETGDSTPATVPVDTDGDGRSDYTDDDSDDGGLNDFAATGVDTRCFVRSVSPDSFATVGSCTTTPVAADLDTPAYGVSDGFRSVTPGTQPSLMSSPRVPAVAATDDSLAFTAYRNANGDAAAVLDTQTVTIIVPADHANLYDCPFRQKGLLCVGSHRHAKIALDCVH